MVGEGMPDTGRGVIVLVYATPEEVMELLPDPWETIYRRSIEVRVALIRCP